MSILCAVFGTACGGPSSRGPNEASPASSQPAPTQAAPNQPGRPADVQGDAENTPPPAQVGAAARDLVPSNASGCAPGSRCLSVTQAGRPLGSGGSIAQCRGLFPDFIVPKNTMPAGYAGPWFAPERIEQAHTGIPQAARPWTSVDPADVSQRLAYLLTLRNYAFASAPVRALTPMLTDDGAYVDPVGANVPAGQRGQKWYPAPAMTYGVPSQPGAREAAHGTTRERRVPIGELGGNTAAFLNYAVAYHDARAARTYARVWSTASPGVDRPDPSRARFTEGSLVFKLIYSAARPADFPVDLLTGSLELAILPNAGAVPVPVRLLQIDVAVKDQRAGLTGWYFATYAFDRTVAGASPWRKMVPVGLMWGNDPSGAAISESWINPAAPGYARTHLGVGGRLNGPIDNPASACMSCHSTAQVPSLANILPPSGVNTCTPQRASWFRNLPGTQPFGRFDPRDGTCETALNGVTLSAADYSLQLSATIAAALPPSPARFNPCTWDAANPPGAVRAPDVPAGDPNARRSEPRVFPVTRDPKP